MKELVAEHNSLTGVIPSSFYNFSALLYMILAYNSLSGTVPTTLTSMSSLSFLYLNNNQLIGTDVLSFVPPSVISLDLSSNLFSGEFIVHAESSLEQLYISDNSMHGAISTSLALLVNLTEFDLSYNEFSGTVPTILNNVWYSCALA